MRHQSQSGSVACGVKMLMLALSFSISTVAAAAAQGTGDFQIQYPGVYPARQKELVEKYFADNQAINERGPVDVKALIAGTLPKDTPGIGPKLVATREMVLYDNNKYDPDNPVLNVEAYAKKLGYQNILAYPTFGACDDYFMTPFPPDARDTLLVSQLNHSVTNYRPVYPGDTLYMVANKRTVADLTPQQGSIYRAIAIRTDGSIYNQHGEKVSDVIFRVLESVKIYKDDKRPKTKLSFMQMWESPNWMARPAHLYTDKDWQYIKGLWAKEKRQGAAPLYWEDVKVGAQPQATVDGPVEVSAMPHLPYGMGVGGSRTLRKEIMDPGIFRTMVRSKTDGIYRLPNTADEIPAVPDGAGMPPLPASKDAAAIDTGDIHKKVQARGVMINFVGRDLAIHHIDEFMGDHGWLYQIRWGIMSPYTMKINGKPVQTDPDDVNFLDEVPFMKGKHVDAHPLTGDLFIIKSYVADKFFRDGVGFVKLAWWIQTIDGYIIEAGDATVALPSRKANLTIPNGVPVLH